MKHQFGLVGLFFATQVDLHAVASSYPVGIDAIEMKIEIEAEQDRFLIGENFPITIRIVNPNEFDVYLIGFEFGPLEPRLQFLSPNEREFQNVSMSGTISAFGGPPIRIRSKENIQRRRLIYSGTRLDGAHWVAMPSGVYRFKFDSHVGIVNADGSPSNKKVLWKSNELFVTLLAASGRNSVALDFLKKKAIEMDAILKNPPLDFKVNVFQMSYYRDFLSKYADTVYAAEVRLELIRLLGHGDSEAFLRKDTEVMDLYEESVMFCLERGGAHAEELLEWDINKPSPVYEFAVMNKRLELLKLLNRKIDEKYPHDSPARLFRHAIATAMGKGAKEARLERLTLKCIVSAASEVGSAFVGCHGV